MARFRRHRSRRGGGFGLGRLLTAKNLIFTLGAAYLAPKILGIDSKLAAAAGGFMGAGPIGAVAGYLVGDKAISMVSGILPSGGTTSAVKFYG